MNVDPIVREEFLQLLIALVSEPSLDGARRERLDRILREHPELQSEYRDYLEMEALLLWQHGDPRFAEAIEGVFAKGTPVLPLGKVSTGRTWASGRLRLACVAACLAVAIVGWFALRSY